MTLKVANTGDRPVQVGSHYHFSETNEALRFDRAAARGFRLDVPAGAAVRFEPGQEREVVLVAYAGARKVFGFNGAVMGALDRPPARQELKPMARIDRAAYAQMFGPTTGDRVRLADTALVIEVEDDRTVYGEEVKFGGGKVVRDGMGQSQRASGEAVDTVITNAPHPGPLGHRQGGRGHPGRAHRRDRQGRQPRRPAGGGRRHRSGDRSDRRRGPDPHRGRARCARPTSSARSRWRRR